MEENTMDFDEDRIDTPEFARTVRDLERITRDIAERYIVQGVPLTWRLLLAIEAEALADLGFAGRHESALRALFARPDGRARTTWLFLKPMISSTSGRRMLYHPCLYLPSMPTIARLVLGTLNWQ
jgi:hypothetical protein